MKYGESQKGFTLIELGIVMVVSAILLISVMEIYRTYLNDRQFNESFEKQSRIVLAINDFSGPQRRYPCPAPRTIADTDPGAGVEMANCEAFAAAIPINTCDAATGICRVEGARDTQDDADNLNDFVLIGAIPYLTLREGMANARLDSISAGDTIDPWGFQMTYAVTLSQTIAGRYNPAFGAIRVRTEVGPDETVLRPRDSGQFVVVMHGENHRGAYTRNGQLSTPCVGVGDDVENCDDDSDFIAGIRRMGEGARYYDDIIEYQSFRLSRLWLVTPGQNNNIYNVNAGFVGVGTDNPQARLHVNGNIRAERGLADQICDSDGANCFAPEKLGGDGMVCVSEPGDPAGSFRAATGFANGEPICSDPIGLAGIPVLNNASCPNPGEFVVGFDIVTGDVICEVP